MKKCFTIFFVALQLAGYSQLRLKLYVLNQKSLPSLSLASLTDINLPVSQLQLIENKMQTITASCSLASGCSAVPVKSLVLQGARLTADIVKLDWKTLFETDVKGFNIERSYSNSNTFLNVNFSLPQISNTPEKEYVFNDNNSYENKTYYRIQQVDINGNFTYSNIILIKGIAGQEMLQVFPNPANAIIKIMAVLRSGSNATLSFIDDTGKIILQQNNSFVKGVNMLTDNISFFAPGVYIIKVTRHNEKDLLMKFVKY